MINYKQKYEELKQRYEKNVVEVVIRLEEKRLYCKLLEDNYMKPYIKLREEIENQIERQKILRGTLNPELQTQKNTTIIIEKLQKILDKVDMG